MKKSTRYLMYTWYAFILFVLFILSWIVEPLLSITLSLIGFGNTTLKSLDKLLSSFIDTTMQKFETQ